MSSRLEMFMELEQVFRHILRQIRKDLSEVWGDKVNGAEFEVLKQLLNKSPQIVTSLAHDFDVSVSHITHVVDQLEKKNLAYRKRSQLDKRVVELHLTDEGRQLIEELVQKKSDYFQRKFKNLSTQEVETLLNLLHKIN
ncbi:MarR family winged helix-turn-helix transcriptional regulator [Thermoactinomyces mirandus]|uniref:MarR family transcriptional regulator n=1 Tax=Thermoactinomyces mirandus TaxID=2756294 RepID=A0A7W1XR42_9BACL|nr:MarR family transcriptional regulator [Thermoactinomyces mirandus]MBA4601652.1 MarR family transcriptional regulator [Thermoactinomyces mirandus]